MGHDENTEFDMLQTRIKQVEYLAAKLDEYGIPYQRPVGGHALFIDADKVLDQIPKEEFPAQRLTIELYLEAGVRGCEIGYLLADRDPVTRENRFGGNDFLRLGIGGGSTAASLHSETRTSRIIIAKYRPVMR